jgi:hypothetical protein
MMFARLTFQRKILFSCEFIYRISEICQTPLMKNSGAASVRRAQEN